MPMCPTSAESRTAFGHFLAFVTIFIWGTTFVSTKTLLLSFTPVEILLLRFVMAYGVLWLFCPKILKGVTAKEELVFAAAGLTGICLYYLLENIALTMTLAGNVGVLITMSPFFTVLLSRLFLKDQPGLTVEFFVGFMLAIAGIALIGMNGAEFELNPAGDILALTAALVWACYAVLTRKMADFGYGTVACTRRTFFWGILFMLPTPWIFESRWQWESLTDLTNIANLLFLGLGASALCFATWNYAIKTLGTVKTSVYIYLIPVVTILTAAVILGEPVTWKTAAGCALTIVGLTISQLGRLLVDRALKGKRGAD